MVFDEETNDGETKGRKEKKSREVLKENSIKRRHSESEEDGPPAPKKLEEKKGKTIRKVFLSRSSKIVKMLFLDHLTTVSFLGKYHIFSNLRTFW